MCIGWARREFARPTTDWTRASKSRSTLFFFGQHFTLRVQRNSAASVSRQLLVLGFQSASVLREGQDQINRDSSVLLLLLLLLDSASRLEDFFGGFCYWLVVLLSAAVVSHVHPLYGGEGSFRLDPASPAFFLFFSFLLRHRRSQDKLFGFACRVDRKQLAALSRALLQFSHSVFVSPRQRIASSRSGGHPTPLSRLCRSAETGIVHSASAVDTVRTEWPAPLSPNRRRHELGRPLTYLVAQCVCDFYLIWLKRQKSSEQRHKTFFHDGYERLRHGAFLVHFGRSGRHRPGQRITRRDVCPAPSFAQRYELLHLFHVLLRTHHRNYRSTRFRQLRRVSGKKKQNPITIDRIHFT